MDLRTYLALPGHSQAKLARRITDMGRRVTQGAISQWLHGRVPAERVLHVERATHGRVTRYELRPDLYPRDHAVAG